MAKENSANEQRNQAVAQQQRDRQATAASERKKAALARYAMLTKRNREYMLKLEEHLAATNLAEDKRQATLHQMAEELSTKQRQGVTAIKLYGPVEQRVELIVNGPKEPAKPQPFWVAALDNVLIMFMLFALMFAFMLTFSKSSASTSQMGVITLFGTAIIAGVGMAYFYRNIQPQPGQPRRPFWQMMVLMIGLIAVWMVLYFLMALIPAAVNVVLPPLVDLILAAIAFVVRLYLKQRLHFQSPFMAR